MSVITQASQPTNVEETRSLLGMARYEAGLYLNMGRRTNQAFDELKDRMADRKMLSYFNTKLPTELVMDAIPHGLGAILKKEARWRDLRNRI